MRNITLHKEVQMKGLVSRKVRLVILSLSLIVVFGLLLNNNEVKAQDGLRFVTLFQGQSATVNFSQATPFGMNSVFVTSIGNRTLRADFRGATTVEGAPGGPAGFWLLTFIATGGLNSIGVAGGYIPLSSGQEAFVDSSEQLSFGLATASVFLYSLGEDDVYNYGLRIQP